MAVGYQPIQAISEKYFDDPELKEVTYDYSVNSKAILGHLLILTVLGIIMGVALFVGNAFGDLTNPQSALNRGPWPGMPATPTFIQVCLFVMGLAMFIMLLGALRSLVYSYRHGLPQLARLWGFTRADRFLQERGSDRYFVHPADRRILFNRDFLIYRSSFFDDSLVPYKELDLDEAIDYRPANENTPAHYLLTFRYGPEGRKQLRLSFDSHDDAAFLQEIFWTLKEDNSGI